AAEELSSIRPDELHLTRGRVDALRCVGIDLPDGDPERAIEVDLMEQAAMAEREWHDRSGQHPRRLWRDHTAPVGVHHANDVEARRRTLELKHEGFAAVGPLCGRLAREDARRTGQVATGLGPHLQARRSASARWQRRPDDV